MNLQQPYHRRILALPGSLRRDSYNRRLAEAAVHSAPVDLRIAVYADLAGVPMFDEDREAEHLQHGGAQRLREAVANADGLLIATPEYNQSLPGVLKNAIDWLSRPGPEEPLAGKPVAIMGASTGRWGTRLAQAALRQTLAATEALVMPAPMLFVRDAAQVFDNHGGLHDAATGEALQILLLAFSSWIARTTPHSARVAA